MSDFSYTQMQRDIINRLQQEKDALTARLAEAESLANASARHARNAEAAARWLWPKVSDEAYDAAWAKWPWLDSEAAKGG